MTIYAIPDVHGYPDQLDRVHDLIAADRAREGTGAAPVVHLGDLGDRGPDTRGVIDRLIAGRQRGEPWIALLGNHDRILLDLLTRDRIRDFLRRDEAQWLSLAWGGAATLASYGVETHGLPFSEIRSAARASVPAAHLDFLSGLAPWHEADGFLFVHAGIRPGVPLHRQSEDDLVWIRDGFLEDPRPHPWIVVHGHTALPEPAHFGNRIALDAGAAYGRPLVAAVFEAGEAWLLDERGRRRLRPPFLGGR